MASCGGAIPDYMRAVVFLDGKSNVTRTNLINNVWEDNNNLLCEHNPNLSLKEQPYKLGNMLKIDKKGGEEHISPGLTLQVVS